MEHQYPGPISGDENMLAELMLPDQAHVRKQDWTIFFLHKDTGDVDEVAEEVKKTKRERKRKREGKKEEVMREANGDRTSEDTKSLPDLSDYGTENEGEDEEQEEEEEEGGEGPPLIYVLNLVYTKQDTSARRSVR